MRVTMVRGARARPSCCSPVQLVKMFVLRTTRAVLLYLYRESFFDAYVHNCCQQLHSACW